MFKGRKSQPDATMLDIYMEREDEKRRKGKKNPKTINGIISVTHHLCSVCSCWLNGCNETSENPFNKKREIMCQKFIFFTSILLLFTLILLLFMTSTSQESVMNLHPWWSRSFTLIWILIWSKFDPSCQEVYSNANKNT